MGRITKIKLILRTLLFISFSTVILFDVEILKKVMSFDIIENIKIYHVVWFYLMTEMLLVLFPKTNKYTYSGKLFLKHYDKNKNYSIEKLDKFSKVYKKRAINAFCFWFVLNGFIYCVYLQLGLSELYMYFLFLFYYMSDMICINIWCPFHKIIVRNKCCNECRIYNWGHIMYLTPLIFVPNFWTYSLVLIGLILFIQWEYMNNKYPERFSSISNKNLRCDNCSNNCRYRK